MENSAMKELIAGDGKFNESGIDYFIRGGGGAASTLVVAIIGPQGSGKSTLLNQLFGTNFKEMDAEADDERGKTTNGIWIAKAPHIEPSTVVLDLEGTDGKERGEDDTTFEKQSALFALVVADTVIINMDFKSVGCEHAASRPLLKIIFEVMLSIFSPQKTTLMFVLRDHDKLTTTKKLEDQLKKDVVKIWEAVPKPPAHEGTSLSEIFDVKVTVLSHYVLMRHDFDQEVAQLKLQLLSHPKRDNIDLPTSKISLTNAKKIWDMIKENKGLKIPPFNVMFATLRCEEIAMDKLRLFQSDQDWLNLEENTKTQLVEGFGAKTSRILDKYLAEYDKESMPFEENVRNDKRQYLTSEALVVIHPAFMATLEHLRSKEMQSFKTQLKESGTKFSAYGVRTCRRSCLRHFKDQCSEHAAIEQAKANWEGDASTVRQHLLSQINEHALSQLQERLAIDLSTQVLEVVDQIGSSVEDTWDSIRDLLKSESEKAKSVAVDLFGEEDEQVRRMVADLEQHARNRVVTTIKDKSRNVVEFMKKRFTIAFIPIGSKPVVKEEAYCQCLDILSTMAVIRIDDTYDDVRRVLHSALMGANSGDDTLKLMAWERVPQKVTLLTPVKCRGLWDKFKLDMELHLANVEKYQKIQGVKKSSLPTWATVRLMILGVPAYIALLYWHPLLAKALLLATEIIMEVHGKYVYSDTGEHIEKDEILTKHPKIMESLEQHLMTASETINSLLKIGST